MIGLRLPNFLPMPVTQNRHVQTSSSRFVSFQYRSLAHSAGCKGPRPSLPKVMQTALVLIKGADKKEKSLTGGGLGYHYDDPQNPEIICELNSIHPVR